jgi:hypothetical protein
MNNAYTIQIIAKSKLTFIDKNRQLEEYNMQCSNKSTLERNIRS